MSEVFEFVERENLKDVELLYKVPMKYLYDGLVQVNRQTDVCSTLNSLFSSVMGSYRKAFVQSFFFRALY